MLNFYKAKLCFDYSIIQLSQQGYTTLDPMPFFFFWRQSDVHHEVCRVTGCTQDTSSCWRFINWAFIVFVGGQLAQMRWLQQNRWALYKQNFGIWLVKDHLIFIPFASFNKETIHIVTIFRFQIGILIEELSYQNKLPRSQIRFHR